MFDLNGDIGRLPNADRYQSSDFMVAFRDGSAYKAPNGIINSQVIVRQASDFENIDPSKVYIVDGIIDMGDTQIVVPPNATLNIHGVGVGVSMLFSSAENYSMFVNEAGEDSGSLDLLEIEVCVLGANSQVFDLRGNLQQTVRITLSQFRDTVSIGTLESFQLLVMTNVRFDNVQAGINLSGSWFGFITDRAVMLNSPNVTAITVDPAATFSQRISTDYAIVLSGSSAAFSDIRPSNLPNDGSLQINGASFLGLDDPVPNVPNTSVKARYVDNVGLLTTYVGGQYSFTATQETVIAASNTPVKLAGVTTYEDLQWFSGNNDNEFTFDSSLSVEVQIEGNISLTGGSNKELGIQIRKFDFETSQFVDIGGMFIASTGTGGRATNVSFIGRTAITENDRIEIWVSNLTDSTNITAELGGFVGISER